MPIAGATSRTESGHHRDMAVGVVREWHDADGWGVLDSDETPGGCWAHVSYLRMDGHARALPGQRVTFTYEPGPQDGFDYRAVRLGFAASIALWEGPAPRLGGTPVVRS